MGNSKTNNTKKSNTKNSTTKKGACTKSNIPTVDVRDLGFNVLSTAEVEASRSKAIDYLFA